MPSQGPGVPCVALLLLKDRSKNSRFTFPAHPETTIARAIRGNPQIGDGGKRLTCVQQWHVLAHPRHDTLLLQQFLERPSFLAPVRPDPLATRAELQSKAVGDE